MSKNLLVTGAAGFLGRHVSAEARRRGYRVTGLDIRPLPRAGALAIDVDFVQADIRDRAAFSRAARGHDYVIHLAALTSNIEFLKNPLESYDVNVNGFLNVIDVASIAACRTFVYASSAAVYLDGFSELSPLEPQRQSNHYAKTKIINEMTARSYSDIRGFNTIGLRYFNVYGPGENDKGDYASIVSIFLKARQNGEALAVYGDGTQARDLIHVLDAARITVDLLERGTHPVYNVGTGTATAYAAIAAMIDEDSITYVPNPLSSYQLYTKADTARLRSVLGEYPATDLPACLAEMGAASSLAPPA